MKYSILKSVVLFAAAVLLCNGSAHSGVVYNFTADSSYDGHTGSFTYTAPSFITGDTTVNVHDLDSCTTSTGVCTNSEYFLPSYLGRWDTVGFMAVSNSNNVYAYYFDAGVFAQFGTFETVVFGANQHGTLTISSDASSVPEPETLALFGLALAGLGLTRRKAKQA